MTGVVVPDRVVRRPPGPALSVRASLTLLNGLLEQGARALVTLLLLPLVIHGLGRDHYGVWVIVQQTITYLVLTDLRAMGALKLTLAARQHVEDVAEKRRQVGAALLLWLGTLPALVAIGALAVWLAPALVDSTQVSDGDVRIVLTVTLATLALDRLLSLPGSVLRGLNLDYRTMGLDAAALIAGGALSVAAVRAGLGLAGMAWAGALVMVAANAVRLVLVRRAVPWLGAARPSRHELGEFAGRSGWLVVSDVATLLLLGSEVLLVGILVGPAAAAVYATTQQLLRVMVGPVVTLLASGGPGVAGLAGRGEWDRVIQVRLDLQRVAIGVMTVLGAAVLVANPSFVPLWVGSEFFGGSTLNALLVAGAFTTVLLQGDTTIAGAMLLVRARALSTLVAGVVTGLLGVLCTQRWGMTGAAAVVVLGRLALLIQLRRVVAARSGLGPRDLAAPLRRPLAAAAGLLAAAAALGATVEVDSWTGLAAVTAAVFSAAAGLWWFAGLSPEARADVRRRGRLMAGRTA